MFSNLTIGFLAGAGIAAWIYNKLYRSSGGNTRNALIASACIGIAVMVLIATVLGFAFNK